MPVIKRAGGYSWGPKGVVVPTRAQAERIGRAIKAQETKKGK